MRKVFGMKPNESIVRGELKRLFHSLGIELPTIRFHEQGWSQANGIDLLLISPEYFISNADPADADEEDAPHERHVIAHYWLQVLHEAAHHIHHKMTDCCSCHSPEMYTVLVAIWLKAGLPLSSLDNEIDYRPGAYERSRGIAGDLLMSGLMRAFVNGPIRPRPAKKHSPVTTVKKQWKY